MIYFKVLYFLKSGGKGKNGGGMVKIILVVVILIFFDFLYNYKIWVFDSNIINVGNYLEKIKLFF